MSTQPRTRSPAAFAQPKRVDFFFVGVGKCGTSWLYEFLRSHQSISAPSIKEPYLIDAEPAKREQMIEKLYDDHRRMADFSNVYYWDPENPRKIQDHNADAKIIITIRHPEDRIKSHFSFLMRNGMTAEDTLANYIDAGDEYHIIERCDYRAIIDRYTGVFGDANVLVLPLEQLAADPETYVDRLLTFLDAPPVALTLDDLKPVLKASKARSRTVARLAKVAAVWIRKMGMLSLLGRLKSSSIIQKVLFKDADNKPASDYGTGKQRVRQLSSEYERVLQKYSGNEA